MNIKLITLWIILSLIILLPIAQIIPVYANDGEQQPFREQSVIDPDLKEYMANLKSTDNICVTVSMERKLLLLYIGNFVNLVGKLSLEMQKIAKSFRSKGHLKLSKMVDSACKVLNYFTSDLRDYLQYREDIDFQEDHDRIERVPDTYVTGGYLGERNYIVETKVKDVVAIAAVPGVLNISPSHSYLDMSYLGLKLISPNNGSLRNQRKQLSFKWEPYEDTTKYRFVLSKDPAMTQIFKEAEVTNTNYVYDDVLDYKTNYFWRVMALEPTPSDWSATFSFQTDRPLFLRATWFPIRVVIGLIILVSAVCLIV